MMSPRIASIPSRTAKVVALVLAEHRWYAPAANIRTALSTKKNRLQGGSPWHSWSF